MGNNPGNELRKIIMTGYNCLFLVLCARQEYAGLCLYVDKPPDCNELLKQRDITEISTA